MLSDMIPILFDGPKGAALTLVLAHGAGAAMDSPFMAAFAQGLGARGIAVARFEFPYMAARRTTGKKRPPDRQPILLQTWREVISRLGARPGSERLAIGGKSMGGRMASLLAAESGNQDIHALVCLSYPFHPAGKPCHLRTGHLADLSLPIQMHWCLDGDHDLTPRKRSGYSRGGNWDVAMDAVAGFLAPL
jgi:predicted alpha/beta-hydrolase family hydrolase